MGAVLGLSATLWGTFIGKTIPDLLRNDTISDFRHDLNHACTNLQHRMDERGAAVATDSVLAHVAAMPDFLTQLVSLNPPAQYSRDYQTFVNALRSVQRRLRERIDIDDHPLRLKLRRAEREAILRTITLANFEAGVLDVDACGQFTTQISLRVLGFTPYAPRRE